MHGRLARASNWRLPAHVVLAREPDCARGSQRAALALGWRFPIGLWLQIGTDVDMLYMLYVYTVVQLPKSD